MSTMGPPEDAMRFLRVEFPMDHGDSKLQSTACIDHIELYSPSSFTSMESRSRHVYAYYDLRIVSSVHDFAVSKGEREWHRHASSHSDYKQSKSNGTPVFFCPDRL